MKRITMSVTVVVLGCSLAGAVHGGTNVNVNIGLPVVPVPLPPPIVLPEPPEFIFPPALGFYVAVGVPHDIFLIGSNYYLYKDNGWYRGRHYSGPWSHVERRQLPPGLRKHKFERIRHYRDEEYRRYRSDHDGYRGRRFRPDKEGKGGRREDNDRRKEERSYQKEERKNERRYEKEERKHEQGEGRGHGR